MDILFTDLGCVLPQVMLKCLCKSRKFILAVYVVYCGPVYFLVVYPFVFSHGIVFDITGVPYVKQ